MAVGSLPRHLESSKLGTKAYWDECYNRELNNYSENAEDEGTVWFADSGAEEKVIEYLARLAQEGLLIQGDAAKDEFDNTATSFLDLGTGNGHLLFALREEGFAGHMLGVDYSAASVQLATQIEQTRRHGKQQEDCDDITGSLAPIDFKELDILSSNSTISQQFDVMLDKGTFDAISLSSELDLQGRRTTEQYRSQIKSFLKKGGLFVITSCNWTEDELRNWLEVEDDQGGKFHLEDRLRYPTFRFQGQEGQTVVTLCFRQR